MASGGSGPRSQISHKEILQDNYVYLMNNLSSEELLDYLYQEKVLDRREYNRLKDIRLQQDRTPALIEKIEQKDRKTFGKFLLSLEKCHSFVIDHLEKTTGISLREEFQVDSQIQTDPTLVIQKLQKEKHDLEMRIKHEAEVKELQLKHKEQAQAHGNERDKSQEELQEEDSRLNTQFKGETEAVEKQISNYEERIRTVKQSQMDEQPLPEVPTQKQTSRDDEKMSSLQAPVYAPADIETFFKAIRQGKLVEVKRLLSQGLVDVNSRGEKGCTAVIIAALYSQGAIFDFLVQNNCDLSAVDDDNDSVIHFACIGNSEFIVKKLLDKHNVDLECRGEYGRTPLMRTVYKGYYTLVEYLKKRGADISSVDDYNNNILHVASLCGNVQMVQYVLSLNITDIECRGQYGRTPLMHAVEKGHLPLVCVLRNRGADINTVDDNNNNILHVASLGGNVEMVQYVLSLNITDVECRGKYGRTPLMSAVEKGHLPLVRILRNRGADINTVDDNNNNILHVASLGGNVEMVQYVLSLNITDVECRGKYGRTPLMHAVEKGHLPLVRILRNRGADINTVDDNNNNILHVASLGGNVEMVQYVLSLNITDVECRGQYGRTPLMHAVEKGHLPLVRILRNRGADINTVDDYNSNILHVASLGGNVEMVQYVLSLNITGIECRGEYGRTPLMYAVQEGHLPLVRILRNRGADINSVDDDNNNILHVACVGGHIEMVKYLVTLVELRGFENRKNKDGDTPVEEAQLKGYDDIVSFLQSRK